MHILITADTIGGVWTYTQELATGLVRRGHRVTLVSFGDMPQPEQLGWMANLPIRYWPTAFRLEWMQDSEQDIEESSHYLQRIIDEVNPDILHFNQYCYGSLRTNVPKIVVAHSDVISWWVGVYGREPDDTGWTRGYRETVLRGLRGADLVIAPSGWMLDVIRTYYLRPRFAKVVYNGRSPELFSPNAKKKNFVLTVGRLWDAAKQSSLLSERHCGVPVRIVGSVREPGKSDERSQDNAESCVSATPEELRTLFAEAPIYAATSRYEPFGLAPVEAAFSRCALVANDIPVFHELWGDAACYFRQNDPDELGNAIRRLSEDPQTCKQYAERAYETAYTRFTAERMLEDYETLYQALSVLEKVA